MTVLTILTSAILIILIFIQMHNSMRIEERRQELEELMEKSNNVISKFDSVFGEMTQENERYSSLISRVHELDDENEKLFNENKELNKNNKAIKFINEKLIDENYKLHNESQKVNEELEEGKRKYGELAQRINTLQHIKDSLEIALKDSPAQEYEILSESISELDVNPSIINSLINNGIYTVGDLVRLEPWRLLKFERIGFHTIESIQNILKLDNLKLGMNVTCVDGRWYLLNTEKIEEE